MENIATITEIEQKEEITTLRLLYRAIIQSNANDEQKDIMCELAGMVYTEQFGKGLEKAKEIYKNW